MKPWNWLIIEKGKSLKVDYGKAGKCKEGMVMTSCVSVIL